MFPHGDLCIVSQMLLFLGKNLGLCLGLVGLNPVDDIAELKKLIITVSSRVRRKDEIPKGRLGNEREGRIFVSMHGQRLASLFSSTVVLD